MGLSVWVYNKRNWDNGGACLVELSKASIERVPAARARARLLANDCSSVDNTLRTTSVEYRKQTHILMLKFDYETDTHDYACSKDALVCWGP